MLIVYFRQAPFAATFIFGIVGSIIYFLASVFPKGRWAVNAILVGRFISGMCAGGKSLVYSWVATVIPLDSQKIVISIMAMAGIAGQAIGPMMNMLVAEIDITVAISSSYSIHIDHYNSVGLLVALNEVLLWVVVVLFLKDPPPPKGKTFASEPATEATLQDIAKALMNFDILFPVIQQFVMSANYTLFGISLLPLASHMLGWTPVQISKLTALQSVVTFVGMLVMMYLSIRKTTDFTMLSVGNGIFVIAGVLTYAWWRMDTGSVIKFAFPIMVTALAFPFTGPANQSSFNRAVFSRPELASSIGVLQSLYAQGGTVAGIVAVALIFVTAFVLRQPKDINLNSPFESLRD